ncbi:MAG: hypothetical protein COA79_02275 [Planctomycetota bacterium]|nr:MAG: hypothetical protein COA79_02275 [Planctomycetota bacterium]
MNGFILASTEGNAGKTVATLSLLTALTRNDIKVDVFKNSGDFIDPLLHKFLTDKYTYNLDTWLMGKENVAKSFANYSSPDHLQIIEGSKGLFDGYSGSTEEGSTAHLAKTLGLPVVLVMNANDSTNTIATIAHSFRNYDPQVKIAGVILNFVQSDHHKKHLMESMAQLDITVFGCIPKEDSLSFDKAYNNMLKSIDFGLNRKVRDKLTEIGASNFDLEGLCKLEYVNSYIPTSKDQVTPVPGSPTIAVARDVAFSFYYQENIDIMKKFGATIVEFSPLDDNKLPDDTSAIYIGGGSCGYYGDYLEGNGPLRIEIKRLAQCGLPIYAESAGLIYLSAALSKGRFRRTLVSIFDFEVSTLPEIIDSGYIDVSTTDDNPLMPTGGALRGIQIKVADINDISSSSRDYFRPFNVTNYGITEAAGRTRYNTVVSSAHIHFANNLDAVQQFVEAASAFKTFQNESN